MATPTCPIRLVCYTLLAAWLAPALFTAEADPVSRDLRDTSERTTRTTGKVVVAVPLHATNGLGRVEPGEFHGKPVFCCDELAQAPASEYKLILLELSAADRYTMDSDLCDRVMGRNTTLQTVQGKPTPTASPENDSPGASTDHANADEPETVPIARFTVIASGPTKRTDLPEAMRADAWALLNANRFRDAAEAFSEAQSTLAIDQAGTAIAAAMTGSLDEAADRFAALMSDAEHARALAAPEAADRVSDRLSRQLLALADTVFPDRPEVQAALRALASQSKTTHETHTGV